MTAPIMLPVSGFRAERVLDQDRMATVWLVADADGRSGVLTIGHRVLVEEPARAAFVDWARVLDRVAVAPAVADLLGSGLTTDARPYLAVATESGTLADRLADSPLMPGQAREHGRLLAGGLALAHANGLTHGAVRPATVLMSASGPLLAGFGLTAPGLGEPLPVDVYTAPEHLDDALAARLSASQPADVYDLAVTLFVAVGGRLPWADEPTSAVLRGQLLPPVAGLSGELLALLQTCVMVDPTSRPTAAALERMLAAVEPGTGATAPRSVDPDGLRSSGIRRVAAETVEHLATGFAGALGGAVGATVATRMLGPTAAGPPPAAPPAASSPAPPAASSPAPPPPAASPPGVESGTGPASAGSAGSAGGGTASGVTTSIVVKILVVVLATAGVVAGGAYVYEQSRDRSQAVPAGGDTTTANNASATTTSLSVQPAGADFGTVWLGSRPTQTLTITNDSTSETTPEPAVVTGTGFALQQDNCGGRALPPGGTCTIVLAFQPTERNRYAGELSLRAGNGVLRLALAGQGNIADLAGSYALTRQAIDPPSPPGDSEGFSFWDGANEASIGFANAGIELQPRTDCGVPGCGYTLVSLAGGQRTLNASGDGTYVTPDRTATIRPERIENGRVASLVLILVAEEPGPGFTVTATFHGTRRP